MSDQDPIDWPLIDRYLAGECDEADARAVESRRAVEPAFADALEAARVIRAAGSDRAPNWDLARVWRGVARETAQAQDPVDVRMPPPPRPRRTQRTRTAVAWRRLAAAALIVVGSTAAWLAARRFAMHPTPAARVARDYTTTAGQRTTLALADGSQITMAPDSRLRVPSGYGRGTREVTLEGEAAFVVQHDAEHPFMVRTAQAVTRDVGTTFDVSAYPGSATTRVVVAEGRVDVRGVSLVAGQLAVVESRGTPKVVRLAHADHFLAWRTGQLVFDATPVPEVVATISRWYDLDVRVTDSALAARHVTATYTNAPADEVLTSLGATLSATIQRQGRIVMLAPLRQGSM
jgi:ferric-dicitrate binding protein FerR (iron transport regulator)